MAKVKFRKIYLVVDGNIIFGQDNYQFINMYRSRSYAEQICKQKQKAAVAELQMHYAQNYPMPNYKVHAFFLVHESLFEDPS